MLHRLYVLLTTAATCFVGGAAAAVQVLRVGRNPPAYRPPARELLNSAAVHNTHCTWTPNWRLPPYTQIVDGNLGCHALIPKYMIGGASFWRKEPIFVPKVMPHSSQPLVTSFSKSYLKAATG